MFFSGWVTPKANFECNVSTNYKHILKETSEIDVSVYRKDLFRSLSFCFVKILWRIQIVPLHVYLESVVGSVIQATGTVEFEDDLRTRVLPGGCWYPCGGRT